MFKKEPGKKKQKNIRFTELVIQLNLITALYYSGAIISAIHCTLEYHSPLEYNQHNILKHSNTRMKKIKNKSYATIPKYLWQCEYFTKKTKQHKDIFYNTHLAFERN